MLYAASMSITVTQDSPDGDDPRDDRLVVTQEIGNGWEAVMTWDGPVQGGPGHLEIRNTGDDLPVGGITTPLFREIRIAEAIEQARRQQVQLAPSTQVDPAQLRQAVASEGLTDLQLARIAGFYVALVNGGTQRPVRLIADEMGKSEVTVRSWLTQARKRGFLTGAHGKLGGTITAEGRALLDAHRGQGG